MRVPTTKKQRRKDREQLREAGTVPCELCSTPTTMTATKRCDACWELERMIRANPALAAKLVGGVPELCEYIKDRIRLCDHGYIYITCGQCVASWLPR